MSTRDLTLEELRKKYEEAKAELKKWENLYNENPTRYNELKKDFAEKKVNTYKSAYEIKKAETGNISEEDAAIGEAFKKAGMGGGTSSFEATITTKVSETPSSINPNTGTTTYGALPSDYKQTEEEAIKLAEEWQQSKKTPAPAELTKTSVDAYKQLIETNPPGQEENIKQIKEKFSDVTTEDGTPLGDLVPKDLSELSEAAQKKAIHFKDALTKIPIPDSLVTGMEIVQADPFKDTTLDAMTAEINNTFKKLKSPLAVGNSAMDISASIKDASEALSGSMSGMVTQMNDKLTSSLMGSINKGLLAEQDRIYGLSVDEFAKEFGTTTNALAEIKKIQRPFIKKVDDLGNVIGKGHIGSLLDTIGCSPSQVSDALPGVFNDLISSSLGNVTNTPSCVTEQIIGAATSKVVNMMDSIIGPALKPMQDVLDFKFDIKDTLFKGVDMATPSIPNLCGGKGPKEMATNKFILGMGPKLPSSITKIQNSFNNIFESSALKNKVSGIVDQVSGIVDQVSGISDQVSDFEKEYGSWGIFGGSSAEGSPLDNCNTGPVESSGPPKIEAFGGGGSGLKAEPILGNFVNRLNPDDIFAPAERTASIVGVRIVNSGRGYTSPPIVTFEDDIGQGYGAYAKATIDQNPNSPTYGQVTSISITSTGENYPASDEEDPMFIGGVVIDDPGLGYEDTDTLEDFELTVVNGQIVNVNVVNHKTYDDLPELNINTTTGFGAKLRPLLTLIPPAQGEVIQVIDCIGKV